MKTGCQHHEICVHLKVAEDIGQGLLALHERGIVHRDLKPHNVLLTAHQRAKVSDMGHCKRLLDQQASFESPGAGMGKAIYVAQDNVSMLFVINCLFRFRIRF